MVIYNIEKKTLVIPQGFTEAASSEESYGRGYSDGMEAQKAIDDARITPTINITNNGEYTADYGYGKVNVNVASGSGDCSEAVAEAYASGITEGKAEQKALLSSTAITRNGTFQNENGWSSVTVNVATGGTVDGIASGTFLTMTGGYDIALYFLPNDDWSTEPLNYEYIKIDGVMGYRGMTIDEGNHTFEVIFGTGYFYPSFYCNTQMAMWGDIHIKLNQ